MFVVLDGVACATQQFLMNAKNLLDTLLMHVKNGRLECCRPAGQRRENLIHALLNGIGIENVHELRERKYNADDCEECDREPFVPMPVGGSWPIFRYAQHEHMRSKARWNVFFHHGGVYALVQCHLLSQRDWVGRFDYAGITILVPLLY